jgi:hypothetical protein
MTILVVPDRVLDPRRLGRGEVKASSPDVAPCLT